MNIVTMSRAGAIVRLTLQTLIAFASTAYALASGRPDHVLHWWDWLWCVLAGLFAAQAFVNKAWAASSNDSPPPLNALVGVSAPQPAQSPAQPLAPVSVAPGAAQGASGQTFADVAAPGDDDAEADNLVGGREGT